MKFRSLTALLLASTMAITTLVACGDTTSTADNKESSASTTSSAATEKTESTSGDNAATEDKGITFPLDETMNFTCFAYADTSDSIGGGSSRLDENYTWKYLTEERANITVDLTLAESADITEKRNLTLSSGDYPDFFFKAGFGFDDVNKYGAQGIFIPLEDLMREYAPNFCAVMDASNGWDYITAPDGHVYSFPMENEHYLYTRTNFWLNKVWMDNLSLEEPQSFEDYYNILKAFKEQDANGNGDPNDEIPLALATPGNYSFKYLLVYEDDYSYSYDYNVGFTADGEIINVYTDESFKELLAYSRKLYEEGLVNEDCFVIDDAARTAKGSSADIYGSFSSIASFITAGAERGNNYIMMSPWADTMFKRKPWAAGALTITDACENPEVLVAWADYLYTAEGAMVAWTGVEGKSYEIVDGIRQPIVYSDAAEAEKYKGIGINGGVSMPTLIKPEKFVATIDTESDPNGAHLEAERAESWDKAINPVFLKFTEEENEEISFLKADINSYQDEYLAKVVTGELSLEDSWDDYVKTMESMGVNDLVEMYKTVYDRCYK